MSFFSVLFQGSIQQRSIYKYNSGKSGVETKYYKQHFKGEMTESSTPGKKPEGMLIALIHVYPPQQHNKGTFRLLILN